MTLALAIEALKAVAIFTPEYEEGTAFATIKENYKSLLESHPQLQRYQDYLDFLKNTGGAHIHNAQFSLGIYGFGGYVVTSFDEGVFLDQDRYFRFAEVLYAAQPDPVYVFAFDFQSETDAIYLSPIEQSLYRLSCSSFLELLENFAAGSYPGLK